MEKKIKMSKFLALYFLFSCHIIHTSHAQIINVYSDHYQKGDKVEISISNCSDLPEGMAGKVTSIDTKDKCARFFDGKACSGHSIEVLHYSPSHHNLHDWKFNDKAVSVGPCRDACSTAVTGVLSDEPLQIQIFSRPNFKGAYENILVNGCTLVPTYFIYQTLAIQTNGHCIQLYNNVDCEREGSDIKSIELRVGSPFHEDVKRWHFSETRALSHCSFKCNVSSSSSHVNRNPVLPGGGELILFDGKKFKGNWFKIKVENGRCINITREWEGMAMSIKLASSTSCVELFDQRNCRGKSLGVTSSQDLSERNFDAVTRSLKPCGANEGSSQNEENSPKGSSNPEGTKANSQDAQSPFIISTAIVVPIVGVILSVLLVFYIMRRCHPYKNIMDFLSEKEIQEFLSGLGMDIEANNQGGGNDDDYSTELLAQNKPYNEAYEIPRSQIKFDTKVPLGVGEFGVVFKGTIMREVQDKSLNLPIKTTQVAIKTVKPNTSAQYLRSLLKEVKVMLYIGKHPHIVHIVGCCTENLLKKGEILVLMEYCSKGSLESFLQKNRTCYTNIVKKGKITMKVKDVQPDQTSSLLEYQNIEDLEPHFHFFKLLQWCIEIARGMEFLSISKVVHSDLAARNVLIDDNLHAKIADFGLSRQLYCYSQYVKKRQEPLPWRWLAIESLKSLEFSSKSDVWSYGVLCWEIFTLGEKPYPGVVWSDAFVLNLEDGLRLPKPKYATTEIYNLMIRCWDEDPMKRPTFTEIMEDLEEMLTSCDPANLQ